MNKMNVNKSVYLMTRLHWYLNDLGSQPNGLKTHLTEKLNKRSSLYFIGYYCSLGHILTKRHRFSRRFLLTLMELSNLTAHNRLLMGIQSISAASALAISATPRPARPDEDATGSPDKRT
ncbi:unnamed protein product [Schistosoma margrebowiei]|uniref:Uncharacterized protein n=1 Tax=Schistosoma margrebowiei TaxID=48269 RepID=A0AA84ZZY5_9TREM|nr:unnamed protein product [Schistosoma margrebowiei]